MVKKIWRNNRGTTLIELMIVVAIMGVVMSIAPPLIKSITKFFQLSDATMTTQRNVREALSLINKNLRQASEASIVISQESGQPPYSKIAFTTVDGKSIGYHQSGTELMHVLNGSTKTLSGNLRYLAFSLPRTDDPDIISVSVTFEKGTYEGGTKALQLAIEKVRIMND